MNYAAEALPESLRDLVDEIGIPAVTALVECWGGIRLYVPMEIDGEHVIARRIGAAAARKLSKRFGGEMLPVPRASAAMRAWRDAQIRARYAAESAAALAREFGLTERQIYTIVAAEPPAQMQTDLF